MLYILNNLKGVLNERNNRINHSVCSYVWHTVSNLYSQHRGFVMNNFDAWLTYDVEGEKAELAGEIIEERAKELLHHDPEFDCNLFENFSEDIYSATIEQAQAIEEYLSLKNFEALGRLLWSMSYEMREKLALIQAEKEWNFGKL